MSKITETQDTLIYMEYYYTHAVQNFADKLGQKIIEGEPSK